MPNLAISNYPLWTYGRNEPIYRKALFKKLESKILIRASSAATTKPSEIWFLTMNDRHTAIHFTYIK